MFNKGAKGDIYWHLLLMPQLPLGWGFGTVGREGIIIGGRRASLSHCLTKVRLVKKTANGIVARCLSKTKNITCKERQRCI